MPTVRVDRLIAADPTGAALLLAGRTALDLWPGVDFQPPRRLPTSYVTTFRVSGEGLPATDGRVTLTRSWDAPHAGTRAVLTLAWEGGDARVGAAFRAMAGGFLANLAEAAEQRSFAA